MELYHPLFFTVDFLLLLLAASHLQPSASKAHNNFTDLASLLKFRAHVKDPYGVLDSNWTTDAPFCSWTGVGCGHKHRRVTTLNLSGFSLQGTISPHLANLSFLSVLNLYNNSLTGVIPDLARLPRLARLILQNNRLSGPIPASLGNLSKLSVLALGWNQLGGMIPVELGILQNLRHLNLAENTLIGPLPTTIFNVSSLQVLELNGNKLTGPIPATIGKFMTDLTCMHLGRNQLTGGLDFITSLSSSRYLQSLGFDGNGLTGALPDSVGNLSSILRNLYGSMNGIHGKVPTTLSNLSGLLSLHLGLNELTGPIPVQLANMTWLQELHLHSNRINGSIPSEMGAMKSLGELSLQHNSLSGAIPDSLADIASLRTLGLSSNSLSSTIPQGLWNLRSLTELYLANNDLDGSLSQHVGDLKNLLQLDLSHNRLSGNLTASLGQLNMLTYLDLSSNLFGGQIPPSLGDLISITHLNLSYNSLSGDIPKSFANPRYLSSLDLSHNRLEGKIPDGRVFSNASITSLAGNAALCGAPRLRFPPCPENADVSGSGRRTHLLEYILPAVGSFVALLVCLILLLKLCRRTCAVERIPDPCIDAQCLNNYRMVSYHELVGATNNFSDANLLGRGSFGSVYKACLSDGLIAAIKVLNLDVEGASKSFEAECRALSTLRHRNLLKIISICSNLEFKALVLQFMPNGSLEDWLYSDTHYLDLCQRLGIMIDVSLALEHLHHHHSHAVVHCDIKPGNVLLDEDMVAHVGDFGIAKLFLGDSGQAISTSALGTIGYMAPEYGSMGNVSRRGDVYSFGILLLETFTRKKPTDAMFNGELSLRGWVERAHPNEVLEVADVDLLKDDGIEDLTNGNVRKCLSSIMDLGLLCSRDSPHERILMKDVVPMIQKIKEDCFSCSCSADI